MRQNYEIMLNTIAVTKKMILTDDCRAAYRYVSISHCCVLPWMTLQWMDAMDSIHEGMKLLNEICALLYNIRIPSYDLPHCWRSISNIFTAPLLPPTTTGATSALRRFPSVHQLKWMEQWRHLYKRCAWANVKVTAINASSSTLALVRKTWRRKIAIKME